MRQLVTIMSIVALGAAAPAAGGAQVRQIDPNAAIDGDLSRAPATQQQPAAPPPAPVYDTAPPPQDMPVSAEPDTAPAPPVAGAVPGDPAGARQAADAAAASPTTFQREEVLAAAEKTFGKGAAGLAGILERTLKEQGEPNAYIAGSEGGGAFAVGLRYGKGQLFHKVEGERPIYWTGPSVGFDIGGDAAKVFVLVYNAYDSEELFRRFPAAEGRLYFVGGFSATYLRRGDIVLIPIRLGVGWRQGANIGYMKFSHKSRWFPF